MSRIFSLVVLVCFAVPAAAQDCTIAAYADPAGTESWIEVWIPPTTVSFYVVMFVENTAAAAAYSMTIPGRPAFLQARWSGPNGNGLVIDEPTGTNVALAECVVGFGGNPVVVDYYEFVVLGDWCGPVVIEANTSQDPDHPQYVTCNDTQLDCVEGPRLWGCTPLPSEAKSFGSVKSLYYNN